MYRVGNQKLSCIDISIPVAAGEVIREATMVAVNADGYAVTASKAEGLLVAGCALSLADNTSGDAGAVDVMVRRAVFVWANDGSVKRTDLLKDAYVSDGVTVTLTGTGSSKAGRILAVDDDGAVTVDMS